VRPSSSGATLAPLLANTALDVARVDLRSPAGLAEALEGVDSVIHLAASKAGDFATQFAGTVLATENLLAAMNDTGVDHLVAVSTFSVYDYLALRSGSVVDEHTPIDRTPALRDEYAQTKLVQEELYQAFAEQNRVVIIRPGMIYGPHNLWHALLGAELGPKFVRIGTRATLPLTYVENCAEALVLAAERLADEPCPVRGEIINIVDDDLPTQGEYAKRVSSMIETPSSLTIPWPVISGVAAAIKKSNEVLIGGRAKFPGIVVPDRLHARFKPLRYTNAKAKRLLGWQPRFSFGEAVDRSVKAQTMESGPMPESAS